MNTWYEVEYARSGRSTCKEFRCKRVIAPGELRIGLMQEENDHGGPCLGWFCFEDSYGACLWKTFRYKKFANPAIKGIEDIKGVDRLKAPDQERIIAFVESGGAPPRKKPKLSETGAEATSSGALPPAESAAAAREAAAAAKASAKPAAKPSPKPMGKPKPLPAKSLKSLEKEEQTLQAQSIPQLKELLKLNDQKTTGTKPELVARVAEGIVLGAVPRCPGCSGGRPNFDRATNIYKCPGYMDDETFVKCEWFSYAMKRTPWKKE